MSAVFPTFPTSGKNAKVEISTSDGQALVLESMTKQASYTYRGEAYTNRIYLLGTGKTLLNMRPAKQPRIDIDGILQGLEISPGAADNQVAVSAGQIEVDGVVTAVSASPTLAVSNAAADKCWNAVVVTKSTGVISVVKGTDGATLLDTFGDAAGQRPMTPITTILIGWVAVGPTAYTVLQSDINYLEREEGGIDYEVLPNIGGAKLQKALATIHASTIGGTGLSRLVKFSGSYLDAVMSEIGTAKEWSLTADSTDVSDETFASAYKQSSIGGFSVSFQQLVADKKAINAVFQRQGHCAIRVSFPNGFGWQSAATLVPNITVNPTSMNSMSVDAALMDFPEEAA
jgi:hypothetical protein